jgi:hypothetical protein
MGDERPGQPKDTRIALERSRGQLRQLAVKARGQVVLDFAQLFVHNMEVVDQPFGRGGDHALFTDGLGNSPIRCEEHPPVGQHAWQQLTVLPRRGRDLLGRGKTLGVLLKTLAAEEFGPNRFFDLWQGIGPCTDFAEQALKREKYFQTIYLTVIPCSFVVKVMWRARAPRPARHLFMRSQGEL